MGQQFLAQHKQDYISLSSMASSLAAQILVDVREVGGGEEESQLLHMRERQA